MSRVWAGVTLGALAVLLFVGLMPPQYLKAAFFGLVALTLFQLIIGVVVGVPVLGAFCVYWVVRPRR